MDNGRLDQAANIVENMLELSLRVDLTNLADLVEVGKESGG
jgi:hypothetical protein